MTNRPTSPPGRLLRRPARAAVLATAAVVLLAGCGVREDDNPRPLAAEAVPTELSELAPSPTIVGDLTTQRAFMVETRPSGETVLYPFALPFRRPASDDDRPKAVLEALIQHQPGDSDAYFNAIPTTTGVITVVPDDDDPSVLEINLNQVETSSGNLKLAIAQMLFTATELPGVRGVRFLLNGEPRAVPLEVGESEVGQIVTRADFPALIPPSSTTTTAPPVEAAPEQPAAEPDVPPEG
jgi:hypothetical protein